MSAPKTLIEVLQKIEYEEALDATDERYVDTFAARGNAKTLSRLARKLGLDLNSKAFMPPTSRHILFFGHIGSGKTTELRRYASELAQHKFLPVEVNINLLLDIHNLQYADVLMATVQALLQQLEQKQLPLANDGSLKQLEKWFYEKVLSEEELKEFSAQIESGGNLGVGIPGISLLWSKFTAAFKTNASYKESLRRAIRNRFSEFAETFNQLLRQIEQVLRDTNTAERVLFIIDGTDKLRSEDCSRFFVQDVEQLLAIEALVIYTAPLSLKYEGSGLAGKLDEIVLPMMRLYQDNEEKHPAGWDALRKILLGRADSSLFSSEQEINELIEYCGGHPRELLRLLKFCCELADDDLIDPATVQAAIKLLASDYRRLLEPEDYQLLAKIDLTQEHHGNDARSRKLLYNLALLEYNDGSWQRSHPVVRRLEGYQKAQKEYQEANRA